MVDFAADLGDDGVLRIREAKCFFHFEPPFSAAFAADFSAIKNAILLL
jgi:hypothetical protein